MERARSLLKKGSRDDAGRLWQAAHDMAQTFPQVDPRRAASLDALGTLAASGGDRKRASDIYTDALEAWSAAQDWVATMATAQAARSSTFHLRLETKYPGAYPEITRARHLKICHAGRAGAQANLAELSGDIGAMRDTMAARREAFGRRESGAAAIAAALGEAVHERIMDRWAERPPARHDDERRLYAAALLAPVLALSGDGP